MTQTLNRRIAALILTIALLGALVMLGQAIGARAIARPRVDACQASDSLMVDAASPHAPSSDFQAPDDMDSVFTDFQAARADVARLSAKADELGAE